MADPSHPAPAKSAGEKVSEESVVQKMDRKTRIQFLIDRLKGSNLTFRGKTAETLGDEGDSTAVEPLIERSKLPLWTSSGWPQSRLERTGTCVLSNHFLRH